MSFKMQVSQMGKWEDVQCSGRGGYVYRYSTKDLADSALNMLYPEQCRHARLGDTPVVRVVEDSEPANIGVGA